MKDLDELLHVEEILEDLYLMLIHLEIVGQYDGEDYKQTVQEIFELTKKEGALLVQKDRLYVDLKKQLQKLITISSLPIHLGFYTKTFVIRLDKTLDSICGDPGVEYADALSYDIDRILLKFLNYMIDNPYYEDIREDLIYFKYDIIYLDINMENDFLFHRDMKMVSLDSRVLKDDLPSSKYIDQAILVGEIEEAIKQILSISDSHSSHYHTFIVVQMMKIFARMALCSEEQLALVMNDVNYLMESEEVDFKIKETFLEMTDIFKQIQGGFYFSR